MWELLPAGGVKRPPDGIKIYFREGQTQTYAQIHKNYTKLKKIKKNKFHLEDVGVLL